MSPVQEIINLAAKLSACQAIVEHADSLEQAIGETETRLADCRAQESAANARMRTAQDTCAAGVKEFAAKAEAARVCGEAEAAKRRHELADQLVLLKTSAQLDVDDLVTRASGLRVDCARLANDRDNLRKAVDGLEAEFAALRARLA